MGINVFSGFDGMSCGQIALSGLGIEVDNYFASEIKQHAIKVTQKNFPSTIQLGDITKISGSVLPKIDLFIGGSPCQNFSRANSERKGLSGIKSKLFYEFVRILDEVKKVNPDVKFLLENVVMKKDQEEVITNILGVTPIRINSRLVSGQLRDRLYWTNIEMTDQPWDQNIKLQSVLDSGYTERLKARTLLESDSRFLSTPVKMFHRHFAKGFNTLIFKDKKHYDACVKHYKEHFPTKTATEINEKMETGLDVSVYEGVRYFTKVERERLQGVPEGYCDLLSEKDAACLMGDGWNVPTIKHIFKHLQ